jgi:hypothetical protein
MGEQRFSKIKKTVIILLAVFLVISLTAASASAWYSKTSSDKCKSNLHEKVAKEKIVKEKVTKEKVVKKVAKEKVVKKVAKEKVVKEVAKEKVVKEVAREKVDNKVLDFAENNWLGGGWRGDFRENFKTKFFNIRGCFTGRGERDCDNGWFDNFWDY